MNINSMPDIIAQHRATTARVEQFRTLSDDILNAKASAEAWSAFQCLEHMTFVAAWYLKTFKRLAEGTQHDTFWTKYSPLTSVWNGMYLSFLDPDNIKKLKAPSRAVPTKSNHTKEILEKYLTTAQALDDVMHRIPEAQLRGTVIVSPIAKFITLSAFVGMQAITMHNERHTRQAERAIKNAG
jgi:hypothetical protein